MRRAQASLNEEGQKTVRWAVFPMKAAGTNPLQVAMEVKSWSMGLGPIAPRRTTPRHVRCRNAERPVHLVQRAWAFLSGIVVLCDLPRTEPSRCHWFEPDGEGFGCPCPSAWRRWRAGERPWSERAADGRHQSPADPADAKPCASHERAGSLRRRDGSWAAGLRRAGRDPTAGPDRPASPGDRRRWTGDRNAADRP